ncbi:M48 family metallopeptidase [Halomonas sp. THAF12]|uniref:metalloprotease LoiP n=1 Tax=Halomonas sp. B23F22_10 TaxID=3459515 RepID=UPI00373EF5BF
MQFRTTFAVAALCSSALVAGCESLSPDAMMQTGMGAFNAATLSDEEVHQMSEESCAQMDAEAQIAGADSVYGQRLETIASNLGHEIDGTPVNYKVYLNDQPNAWAMANGCVRVYSGLMDMMNDNEVEGVLGHELGHVALGHSKKSMQTAYATSIARDAMAASGNAAVASLSSSQLGDLGEKFVNAQFSQSQETAADNFSFELLGERGISREGLVTAFEKLASLDGGEGSLMSSHPGSSERAENMRAKLNAEG